MCYLFIVANVIINKDILLFFYLFRIFLFGGFSKTKETMMGIPFKERLNGSGFSFIGSYKAIGLYTRAFILSYEFLFAYLNKYGECCN